MNPGTLNVADIGERDRTARVLPEQRHLLLGGVLEVGMREERFKRQQAPGIMGVTHARRRGVPGLGPCSRRGQSVSDRRPRAGQPTVRSW
jgi:hypothetical protein